MQAAPEKHHDKYSAFRHSSYRRYFWARTISSFGIQILSVSVAWQIYDETQSAFLLGLIGLVQFLPALVLVVLTGIASDKLGRRMVMGILKWRYGAFPSRRGACVLAEAVKTVYVIFSRFRDPHDTFSQAIFELTFQGVTSI